MFKSRINYSSVIKVPLGILLALILGASPSWAVEVDVSYAPGNDLSLALAALGSAQKSILLNIYELTSSEITDVLLNRIQAGVQVVILEEGQPVGGLSTVAQGVQGELVTAMNRFPRADHLFEMTSKAGGKRRFHYDHAKYAVIDGASLLIGSENYSPTGNPQPGSVGNRGWEVFIRNPVSAQQFARVFSNDIQTGAGDILELTGKPSGLSTSASVPPARMPVFSPGQLGVLSLQATQVTPITSPDTSLPGLISMIRSARSTLDIEQMTFNSGWSPTGPTSPLLSEVVAAARRKVAVRVLLNDETVFSHGGTSKPINPVTVQAINQLAAKEGLNFSARVANLKGMGVDYIHNKGVLVDGTRTLISSINWDENAVLHNREAAVLIDGPLVNEFYSKLFESDWGVSASVSRRTPAAVSDHSSLAPTTAVVQCPAEVQVDLKIGALTAGDLEDRDYLTLSGTTITGTFVRNDNPGSCLLVDQDARGLVSERRFVELRAQRDGSVSVMLEGYTPRTSKIYSVRAQIQASGASGISGSFPAVVYAGSGARERLGPASFGILTAR